jgi:polysaccharide biosynthesis protein PslH
MTRIAFVTNYLPAPANSGSVIRANRLARALSGVGDLWLYARASETDARRYAANGDLAIFGRVRLHTESPDIHAKLSRVFTAESMERWMSPSDPLGALLAEDHRSHPFDVVVGQQLFTANAARSLPDVALVLDEHNVESHAVAPALALYGKRRLPVDPGRVTLLVAEYESQVWPRAALITCPTIESARFIHDAAGVPTRVIPNGADVDEIPFVPPSRREGNVILFVGAFFWPPNILAARFLVKEVFPKVRDRHREARLILCGRDPGIEVSLLRRDGVEITGTVPSVVPYLNQATVYANCLFEGSGSSLKVLEALASGVPLVSTSVGARGHHLEPGHHYLQAENADEFANAIAAVLENRSRYDDQAIAGRALAESLSWANIGRGFAEGVQRVSRRGTNATLNHG